MAYFDYSPPSVPDYSEALKPIGDALTEVMRRRQQKDEFDQKMQFEHEQEKRRYWQQQAQIDYQNKIVDAREKRDQLEFNRKQSEYTAKQAERARHAATPQEAEAIVKNTPVYDPVTGKEIGRGSLTAGPMKDIGAAPQMPQEPQEPQVPQEDRAAAAAVVPDIAQAALLPWGVRDIRAGKKRTSVALPEVAAAMRAKEAASPGPVSLDALAQHPDQLANRQAEFQGPDRGKGKLFVDQINDDGIATLIDDAGNKTHAPAQKGWAEGSFIGSDGQAAAQTNENRFDRAAQAYGGFQPQQQQYDQQSQEYAKALGELPGQQAAYDAKKRQAEAERPYTISFPTGAGVNETNFDFKTQRTAAREIAAQDFADSLAGAQLSPKDAEAAKLVYSGIRSGTIKPEQAGAVFQKERLGIMTEEGKNTRAAASNATAIKVQELKNQAPRSSITVGEGNLNMRKFEQFQKDAERFSKRYNVPADINGLKQLNDAVNGISGDNSIRQRGVRFQLVRSMQGAGPVTDQDVAMIAGKVAGVGGSLESWMAQMADGSLGEAEQDVLFGAVKERLKETQTRMQNARGEAEKHFLREQSPYRRWVGDDFIESEMDAMFPGTQSTVNFAAPGAPPEIKAKKDGDKKRRVRATGLTPDAVQGALQRLGSGQ